jgi:hypothetical protein
MPAPAPRSGRLQGDGVSFPDDPSLVTRLLPNA